MTSGTNYMHDATHDSYIDDSGTGTDLQMNYEGSIS